MLYLSYILFVVIGHIGIGISPLCALKATDTKQGENEVEWKQNKIDVGKKCNHELYGPDTVAGGAVTGPRVIPEHKNRPHNSSINIKHNWNHQEYKHKSVQVKGQTRLQFLQHVGGYD